MWGFWHPIWKIVLGRLKGFSWKSVFSPKHRQIFTTTNLETLEVILIFTIELGFIFILILKQLATIEIVCQDLGQCGFFPFQLKQIRMYVPALRSHQLFRHRNWLEFVADLELFDEITPLGPDLASTDCRLSVTSARNGVSKSLKSKIDQIPFLLHSPMNSAEVISCHEEAEAT